MLKELLNTRVLYLDGAYGSNIVDASSFSEKLFTVRELHKSYFNAGASLITINGFDIDCDNLSFTYNNISYYIDAARHYNLDAVLLGSIGPTNKSVSLGQIDFDSLVSIYTNIVNIYFNSGIRCFLIETVTDSLNCKAALYCLSKLPVEVIVSCSPDRNGYLLDSTHFSSLLCMCKSYPNVVAFGFNCGFGPSLYSPLYSELKNITYLPIIFYPNAGIPTRNGYSLTPSSFLNELSFLDECNIIGGCCGTTPAFIKALTTLNVSRFVPHHDLFTSGSHYKPSNSKLYLIGEKLNGNGFKKFRNAAISNSISDAVSIVKSQLSFDVDALDFNVDHNEIKDKNSLLFSLSKTFPHTWVLDSSDPYLLETWLKFIPGRPLINSVSLYKGEANFINDLNQFRRLGSTFIVRAQHNVLDFGSSLSDKIQILEQSISALRKCNIPLSDVLYDICVMPLCIDEQSDSRIRDLYNLSLYIKSQYPSLRITAGISNCSFAFRGNSSFRTLLNRAFAFFLNLDSVIGNPSDFSSDLDDYLLQLFLSCVKGESITERLIKYSLCFKSETTKEESTSLSLEECLMLGDVSKSISLLSSPVSDLVQAFKNIGDLYDTGKVQLIQLLVASDTLKFIFKELNLSSTHFNYYGMLCTVEGDVHDIGKDIVREVISSQFIKVTDLGKNVPTTDILFNIETNFYDFVGFSGLISPSLPVMEDLCKRIDSLKLSKYPVIFLGGAVLYQEFVESIQEQLSNVTVRYTKTPSEMIKLINELCVKHSL